MRFTKKIFLTALVTSLFGIDYASGMSKIKELWSGSSKGKFTDQSTRSETKPSEAKSPARSERGYETTRSTLDELGIVGRSSRSARDLSESRNARGTKEQTEPAKEGRSFLQRIIGRGSTEPRKEIEISGPTGFRKTTDESLARMKPEDAERIRRAQAKENTKTNVLISPDTTTRDTDATKALLQKKESSEEIALRMKRKEEQENKAKGITKDLSSLTNQLNETKEKINQEMKKAPEDRDQKVLKKLNLEKKKLGDKASSMEKTVKNIETKARLDGLSTQELSAEVAQLQKRADQAKKDLELAQAEQNLKANRLKEVRKNLSSDDREKYAKLGANHKNIEEKLADKTTPKSEVTELLNQRKKIRSDIQNISPELAKQHYELADHEATFVSAKKNVQLTQTPLTIAKSALEERITLKEPELAKTASTKKSVGFSVDSEPATPKKSVGFSVDQKSLEEFEKRAGPPPSKLPPLPPEADRTPNLKGISPAMKRILQDEEQKFNQKKQASSRTEEFQPVSNRE